jgi:hypothetical protein
VRTPDGHSRLELARFHSPAAISPAPENAAANTLGIRRIMFAVDDIEDVVARLRAHGAELVGEITQCEDVYRLCYVRGPEGIVVGLSEQLSRRLPKGPSVQGDIPANANAGLDLSDGETPPVRHIRIRRGVAIAAGRGSPPRRAKRVAAECHPVARRIARAGLDSPPRCQVCYALTR